MPKVQCCPSSSSSQGNRSSAHQHGMARLLAGAEWARGGSVLTLLHPVPVKINKHREGGGGTLQKHRSLVLLAYHKSKHNIFSFLGLYQFLTVQLEASAPSVLS